MNDRVSALLAGTLVGIPHPRLVVAEPLAFTYVPIAVPDRTTCLGITASALEAHSGQMAHHPRAVASIRLDVLD